MRQGRDLENRALATGPQISSNVQEQPLRKKTLCRAHNSGAKALGLPSLGSDCSAERDPPKHASMLGRMPALYRHNISLSWPAGQQFNSLGWCGAATELQSPTKELVQHTARDEDTSRHSEAVLHRACLSRRQSPSFMRPFGTSATTTTKWLQDARSN